MSHSNQKCLCVSSRNGLWFQDLCDFVFHPSCLFFANFVLVFMKPHRILSPFLAVLRGWQRFEPPCAPPPLRCVCGQPFSKMMRRRADLPMASGGRSPTPPRRQMNMPDATPANVLSLTWVLSSLALIGIGYLHCNGHREQSRLHCVEDVCTFSRYSPGSRRWGI